MTVMLDPNRGVASKFTRGKVCGLNMILRRLQRLSIEARIQAHQKQQIWAEQ